MTYDGMRSVGGVGLQAGLLSAIPGALYGGISEARKPMEDGESTMGAAGRIGKGALVGGAVTGAIGGAIGAGMQHKYRGAYDNVRGQANTALRVAQTEQKAKAGQGMFTDFLSEMMGPHRSGGIEGKNPLGVLGHVGGAGAAKTYGQMQEGMENNPSVFGYLRKAIGNKSDAPGNIARTMPGKVQDLYIADDAGRNLLHQSPASAAKERAMEAHFDSSLNAMEDDRFKAKVRREWTPELREQFTRHMKSEGLRDDRAQFASFMREHPEGKVASLAVMDTLARFGLTKTAWANAVAGALMANPMLTEAGGLLAGIPATLAIGRNVKETAKKNPETKRDATYRQIGFNTRGMMPMGSAIASLGTAGALAASSHFSRSPGSRAALIGLLGGMGVGSSAQVYKTRERALDPKWNAQKAMHSGESPEGTMYDSLLPIAGGALGMGAGAAAHYAPAVSVAARGFANDAWGAIKTKLRDMKSAIPSDRLHKMDFGTGVFHEGPRALLGAGR